jgi:serine/threonine protein phosphatase PrpC
MHILPVLFLLSQLLFDGLAGHLLGEFASVYLHEDNKLLVKEHQIICLKSLLSLNLATSNYTTTCTDTSNITAFDALQQFLVSTEKKI